MANKASVSITFESEELAEKALAITQRMIKLFYVPEELPWAAEAKQIPSLSRRCLRFGEEAEKLDPLREHPTCALKWLSRSGSRIDIERCADIQSPVYTFMPRDFFTQLCLCLSKSLPDARFCAVCRHEETVSATVQLNRVLCERGELSYEEMWILDEDEDADEDDWSRACKTPLRDIDGIVPGASARDKA